MRCTRWLLGLAVLFPAQSFATSLTLEQAWQAAEVSHPTLKVARAALPAAEGQTKDAGGLFWNNPSLSFDLTRRKVPLPVGGSDLFSEWGMGLSQPFELAGQQGYRRDIAAQELLGANETVKETRSQVRAEIAVRFIQVWGLQRRLASEVESLRLIDQAALAMGKRVAAGEDSRLDGNLAGVEAERARNQLATATEQLLQARAELAASLQLPPGELPEVSGTINPGSPAYALEDLLAKVGSRSRLQILEYRENSARSRLALERASAIPDLTVGFSIAREGSASAREQVATLGLSLPLPLFRQNAGGIGRASSDLAQARIERETAGRDAVAQVRALWQQTESLKARVQRYTERVLPTLDENKRLSVKAFQAGEVGLLQLLLVNRQVVDANREYLDALDQYLKTRVALEQAAGWDITPAIH